MYRLKTISQENRIILLARMQIVMMWVLEISVSTALLGVTVGGILFLLQYGKDPVSFIVRPHLWPHADIGTILYTRLHFSYITFIQLSIFILMISQVLRLSVITWFFIRMKDFIFIGIGLFILITISITCFKMIGF